MEDYHSTHTYIRNVYDCSEMSQDFWNICYTRGWNAEIGWNIYREGVAHCWVVVETGPDLWVAADPTSGEIIHTGDEIVFTDGIVLDGSWYYNASWYKTPLEFRSYIHMIDAAGEVQVSSRTDSEMTCYDHSVAYAGENPEWGIVTMSNNPLFRGSSHMVNYQLIDEYNLIIHDGMEKADYVIAGWQELGFYHFWIDETPERNYVVLNDNREEILNCSRGN